MALKAEVKANDLMVYNYLSIDGDQVQILAIGLTSLKYQPFINGVGQEWRERIVEDFEGIPLDESILLKFGFEKKWSLLDGNHFKWSNELIFKDDNLFIDRLGFECKYLHTLQNFFSLLCKKHLTFNP